MREVFETSDAAAAEAVMSENYSSMRLTAAPQDRYLRLELERFGRARLDRMVLRMSAGASAGPMHAVCIGILRKGTLTYRHGGKQTDVAPGEIVYVADPHRSWQVSSHNIDADFVMIEPSLLDEAAQADDDGGVRLLDYRPLSSAAARRFASVVAALRRADLTGGDGPLESLVQAQAARFLAAACLAAFPSNAASEPTSSDRRDARPAALRRAVAFIEANAHRDISIADIACSAHVTPRAVQLAFRRHLGVTPSEYLRGVRLQHAFDELKRAEPGSLTVASVAHRWGFGNASQFARRYREAFNTSPGDTLRS